MLKKQTEVVFPMMKWEFTWRNIYKLSTLLTESTRKIFTWSFSRGLTSSSSDELPVYEAEM